jgi:hypothetical protein
MYEALGDLSLDLLRAFEAAARHRSFTAASVELGALRNRRSVSRSNGWKSNSYAAV